MEPIVAAVSLLSQLMNEFLAGKNLFKETQTWSSGKGVIMMNSFQSESIQRLNLDDSRLHGQPSFSRPMLESLQPAFLLSMQPPLITVPWNPDER